MKMETVLKEILNEFDQIFDNAPKKASRIDIVILGYSMSLFEIAKDISILVENKRYSGASILIRSFMETYVDLKNVCIDPNFTASLVYKADLSEKKKYVELSNSKDISESEKPELQKMIREVTDRIKELKKSVGHGIDSPSICQKFKNVGMEWFYVTVYNDMCGFSHNEIRNIERRHIQVNSDEKITLMHETQSPNDHFKLFLQILETYLIDVIVTINEKTIIDCSSQLHKLRKL